VQAAVVITRPDPGGELMLAGYVVLSAPEATAAELRDFLDARLPHYMVPSAIMVLDALPLTPSGKVDRRALPAPTFVVPEPAADARARTHVEQVLSKIWQELLGRRSIGLDENFFDLGGHSLLAMRMLVRVGSELGVKLPVSVMIHSDTITKLAEVITREGGSSPWSVLVPIQPAGDRPPLFCVHGFPGDVLWFHDLGRCLAPDQPFYGLQSRSLAEGQPHALSIEKMAAWYIEGMRSVQPEGPYYMCGASYGGLVVYEMARQLRAYGHEIGLAAVLDYDPYMERETLRERLTGLVEDVRRIPSWLRYEVAPMSPTDFQGRFQRRLRVGLKSFVSLLLGGKKLPVDAADLMHYGAELPLHRRELLIANDYAFERYEPEPYDGRVTLVACQSRYAVAAATAEQTGWAPLARGGVEVVFVPGSHETMYKPPYVTTLALRLRELVDAELARREALVAR
jgi:thioesterase domain-containing protein/acyl carrier protein